MVDDLSNMSESDSELQSQASNFPFCNLKSCRDNDKVIKRVELELCKNCSASYHPGCARRSGLTEDGHIKHCCGRKSRSRGSSPSSPLTLNTPDDNQHQFLHPQNAAGCLSSSVTFSDTGKDQILSTDLNILMEKMKDLIDISIAEKIKCEYNVLKNELQDVKEVQLPALLAQIKKLKEENVMLKDRIVTLESSNANDCTPVTSAEVPSHTSTPILGDKMLNNIQSFFNEIEDRKTRENNIISHNVPECPSSDLDIVNEHQIVSSIFEKIDIKTKVKELSHIKRIGRYDINKTRPILIKMDDRSDVTKVLINWKLIEAPFNVSPDLTILQRSSYKKLKQETKVFNSQNKDSNVIKVVRMVKGNPQISTIEKGKRISRNGGNSSCSNVSSNPNSNLISKN